MIKQIADKHGLALARVATETDDYIRLVRSTIGPPTLLSFTLSFSTSVKLREVFVPILLANGVTVIHGDIDTLNKTFAALDGICVNPPKYQMIFSKRGRDFYIAADASTDLIAAVRKSLMDKRFKKALESSDIVEDLNAEIEKLKQTRLI